MSPNLIDAYRALAGVAGSEKIRVEIKDEAERLMKEIMKVMDISVRVENKQITDFSAQVNGIIK